MSPRRRKAIALSSSSACAAGEVALRHGEVAEVALREAGAARVADPAPDREALLEQAARVLELARGGGEVAQSTEGVGDRPLVADDAEDREALVDVADRPVEVAGQPAHHAPIGERVAGCGRAGHVMEWREGLLEHHPHRARLRLGHHDLAEIDHRRRHVRRVRKRTEDDQALVDQRLGPAVVPGIPPHHRKRVERGGPVPGPNAASVAIPRARR